VSDDASLAQLAPQLTDQFVPGRDFRSVDGEHARALHGRQGSSIR